MLEVYRVIWGSCAASIATPEQGPFLLQRGMWTEHHLDAVGIRLLRMPASGMPVSASRGHPSECE